MIYKIIALNIFYSSKNITFYILILFRSIPTYVSSIIYGFTVVVVVVVVVVLALPVVFTGAAVEGLAVVVLVGALKLLTTCAIWFSLLDAT